ncbi:amino acid ABC transporter permease/ATP-binding protein [Nesterenkonia populi]|uniref:amino acid ABC transporter permease/ATP-binding protein n=1 Tax=Nesterenkonia populi TaxID=1591087 RepID=UPI0011BEACA8|nr:amino acid ABC transporter permease/ATP-binding protein [Nesterenkonia populi]
MTDFLHYLTFEYLWGGLWFTLQLTVGASIGGAAIGFVLAAMLLSPWRAVAMIARAYTTLYRGTPLILQLVFVFTALPQAGITFSPLQAGVIALALNEASFFADIFRSGVLGVGKGQKDAGRALGMKPPTLMRRIIAPQGFRQAIPALGNEVVATMKNSALASVIAVPELTLRTQQLASSTFDYFSIYFAAAVMYLLLTAAITVLQLGVEAAVTRRRPPLRLPWSRSTMSVPPQTKDKETTDESDIMVPEDLPEVSDLALRSQDGPSTMISIENVTKSYSKDLQVLKGIDLAVQQGEVVALLGPSGSGKSTLLRTINHLETIDDGQIRVNEVTVGYHQGQRISAGRAAEQRVEAGVGMVFQNFELFEHLSVRENIAGPLRWVYGYSNEEASQRAEGLLGQVGMSDRIDHYPDQLSGGQKQRVGIARALAPRPKALLLDEPTSALDPERVAEVLKVITDLARNTGLTMIIATHQLRFARNVADKIVLMADGVIIEEGSPQQVLDNPRDPRTQRFVRAMDAAEV